MNETMKRIELWILVNELQNSIDRNSKKGIRIYSQKLENFVAKYGKMFDIPTLEYIHHMLKKAKSVI